MNRCKLAADEDQSTADKPGRQATREIVSMHSGKGTFLLSIAVSICKRIQEIFLSLVHNN